MSVLIKYKNGLEASFCESIPLEAQLDGASMVNITTAEDNAASANSFLKAFCDLSNRYCLDPIEFAVDHGNTIVGARVMRNAKKTTKAVAVRWLVKEIVKSQISLNSKLDDIIYHIKTLG